MYLAALSACLIFYCLFEQWLTWVFFCGLLWLPVFSLLLSLPALIMTRLDLSIPGSGTMGTTFPIRLRAQCKLPCVPLTSRFLCRELCTGSTLRLRSGSAWTPKHCGAWEIRLKRCFLYDYTGLLRLPAGRKLTATTYVEPVPVPIEGLRWEEALIPRAWKPKAGGGFAENHDLRLYRPGDDLRHIHWKMSAKTGNLVYREPMEPIVAPPAILLALPKATDARDQALGELLWLSRKLLERQRKHTIHCLTGNGLFVFPVRDDAELTDGLHRLLKSPGAPEGAQPEAPRHTRCFRIGGERDDA